MYLATNKTTANKLNQIESKSYSWTQPILEELSVIYWVSHSSEVPPIEKIT